MPREIRTKIIGVTHGNRQKLIKKHAKPGLAIELAPEPENPVSPKAVAVYLKQVKRLRRDVHHHLGYLTDERAELVQDYWQKGRTINATITDVTGGTKGKKTRGVNILLIVSSDQILRCFIRPTPFGLVTVRRKGVYKIGGLSDANRKGQPSAGLFLFQPYTAVGAVFMAVFADCWLD